jgi:hypothetical protein
MPGVFQLTSAAALWFSGEENYMLMKFFYLINQQQFCNFSKIYPAKMESTKKVQ